MVRVKPRTVMPYRFQRRRPREICQTCGHVGGRHKIWRHSEDRSLCAVHCKECGKDCYAFGCHGRKKTGLRFEGEPTPKRTRQRTLSMYGSRK